jgi:hypothetical protein
LTITSPSIWIRFRSCFRLDPPPRRRGCRANAHCGCRPDSLALEVLRDQWLAADGELKIQQDIAAKMQVQAFQDVPLLPLGSYCQPTAYKKDLTDMLKGLILFTNVRRA